MAPGFILFVLIFVIVGGAVGSYVGRVVGRPDTGLWLGACFGPAGWIVVLLMGPTFEVRVRDEARLRDVLATRGSADGRNRRSAPLDAAKWGAMLAADDAPLDVHRIIERASQIVGAGSVSSWSFADGAYRLVLRHQGVCDLVSSTAAVRVGRDAAISYGVDAAGDPTWITIDGLDLRRLRPASAARRLVDELGARVESDRPPDAAPQSGWPAPSV